jgi:hypothetical protein
MLRKYHEPQTAYHGEHIPSSMQQNLPPLGMTLNPTARAENSSALHLQTFLGTQKRQSGRRDPARSSAPN